MFYSPIKMGDDPLWVDVTDLMKGGLEQYIEQFGRLSDQQGMLGQLISKLNHLLEIKNIQMHTEEVVGEEMTIDVVVNIFNRVNSGGTKLSKGDLALAKICAFSPSARHTMQAAQQKWEKAGFYFNLDWVLRNVNTITTGEAKFSAMHDLDAQTFETGLKRTEKAVDYLLSLIAGRFGLDHDRVFFGRYAMPVMSHYVDRRGGSLQDGSERDKLLYWYLQNAMWGRYSSSTESVIDKDLKLIENLDGGLGRLIQELHTWRGGLRVEPEHFGGWSLGARFYPVLYLLTRVEGTLDWGTGLELKQYLLGKMNRLEVHHIFPKSYLYTLGYDRAEVNAVANLCFLTKETNLWIGSNKPEVYFPKVEHKHSGALASQWIPMEPELWKGENYREFLEARRALLAEAMNALLEKLHNASLPEEELAVAPVPFEPTPEQEAAALPDLPEGVEKDEEETLIQQCNQWVVEQDLPKGHYLYELADEETGKPLVILDLAWPNGLQEGFSQPVAVLLHESKETLEKAHAYGYRCFNSVESFRRHVERTMLAQEEEV